MQGGIHPEYTGATYLDICRAVKAAAPGIHVHAFTPLEVSQGAATLGQSVPDFLAALREAGLGTLPGTAAEILDDEVRAVICPDKVSTDEWLAVMAAAHALGIGSTATIMFGHVERPLHWARHLLRVRALQMRTRGFSEFIPLPFVHMEAPIYLKGRARRGPSFREAVLMHAVARLALHPHIANIQASWVKLGPEGVAACLKAGVNDLGGTLMNETITRSAGAVHGQEMSPAALEAMIVAAGRDARAAHDALWRGGGRAPCRFPCGRAARRRRQHAGAALRARGIGGPARRTDHPLGIGASDRPRRSFETLASLAPQDEVKSFCHAQIRLILRSARKGASRRTHGGAASIFMNRCGGAQSSSFHLFQSSAAFSLFAAHQALSRRSISPF